MTTERNAQGVDGLTEVMGLLGMATPGCWILATSCSWRRIVTEDSRPVIVPCTQQSDGHPDLSAGEDHINAEAAIAAVNYLRSHGEAIRELVEADREYDTALAAYRFAQKNAPAFNKIAPRRRRLARALARRRAALAKFPEPRP